MNISLALFNAQQAETAWREAWPNVKAQLTAGKKLQLTIKTRTRSLDQNARLWAMLGDISSQVDWYGRKLTPEDWKHLFSSTLRKLEVVPNLEGTGFVALGLSTSKMTVGEMADLQTLIEAFGAEKGVRFSAPERDVY